MGMFSKSGCMARGCSNVYIAPNGPTDSSATWTRPLFIGMAVLTSKRTSSQSLSRNTYGLGIGDEGNCGEILHGVSFLARLRSCPQGAKSLAPLQQQLRPSFLQMRPCLWKILATMCSGPEILGLKFVRRSVQNLICFSRSSPSNIGQVHVRCFAGLGTDTMPHMRDTVLLKGIEAYGKDRSIMSPRGCQELSPLPVPYSHDI